MPSMTKKGARSVTDNLDRVASLFQQEFATLGIPQKIASDFAYRCDLLSDAIEKRAGIDRTALSELDVNQEQGYDPEEIGEEVKGPMEGDSDEPYMKAEFTQQENRELRERVQDGDLGMKPNFEEQAPQAGKQAMRLASACAKLQDASIRLGGKGDLAKAVGKLAHAVMDVQMGIQCRTVTAAQAERTLAALGHLMPHLASVTQANVAKTASLVALAHKVTVAKKSEDEEDEAPAEKQAKGKIPPQFLENIKKKQDEAADKSDDKGDDKGDEKKSGKKASHGFNLFA